MDNYTMKKFFTLMLLSLAAVNFSSAILNPASAEEVSAPNVVAPSQPATSANVAATGVTTTTTSSAAPVQQPSMLGMALPFVVMLGIMYFLMIRPQQKRMKKHQALISELKNGDEVVTTSGIIGTISSINDKVVSIEISKNVQMKVLKSQVNQVVNGSIQEIQA
jgi:preprotein translocase subunit YajC